MRSSLWKPSSLKPCRIVMGGGQEWNVFEATSNHIKWARRWAKCRRPQDTLERLSSFLWNYSLSLLAASLAVPLKSNFIHNNHLVALKRSQLQLSKLHCSAKAGGIGRPEIALLRQWQRSLVFKRCWGQRGRWKDEAAAKHLHLCFVLFALLPLLQTFSWNKHLV